MAAGTGLGLPLAKHIVEDVHGGRLTVESTLGQGSTFIVTLPAAVTMRTEHDWNLESEYDRNDMTMTETHPALRRRDPHSPGGRVQVEAGPATTCEIAGDGQEAWEAIQRRKPDLLITDCQMPRLDGFGLVQKVRENPRHRRPADLHAHGQGLRAVARGVGRAMERDGGDRQAVQPAGIAASGERHSAERTATLRSRKPASVARLLTATADPTDQACPMNLPTEIFGDVIVVHTPEELGADQATASRPTSRRWNGSNVVFDLDATETLDSKGLTALLDVQDKLRDRAARQDRHRQRRPTARFWKSPASTSNWKSSTAWSTP